ncbi:uncharacterized protein LOC108045578 [Drosophila rhopaloa]|uniref:Uncharacterized protein n=1 Tax=Drosophila rhopaloa TaxID=1041015 RepID=A0ABM5HHJ2_DRORH|nr:uncharacterized protein LOC108045578 [Drosophila rhopaloa]
MDRIHKSDEAFDHSMSSSSRRVMWKLNDEEETFDSLVNYRRVPVRNSSVSAQQNRSQVTDVPTRRRTASENWLLLLRELGKKRIGTEEREAANKAVNLKEPVWKANHSSATSLPDIKETSAKERAVIYWRRLFDGIHKRQKVVELAEDDPADIVLTAKPSLALRYKPSHESLKYKRSKDSSTERFPSTSRVLVTDLKLESFSLPPQQTCVVREVEPRFAHRKRMSITHDTDSCCSGELEVPKNSPVQDQDPGPRLRSELISVHVSAPTARRSTSPIRRRTAASKVSAGTKAGSSPVTATAAGGNKGSSASSGSAGTTHLPTFRQRQQELHRYRVMIERRRLDLLELKIAREREEALHSEILFHKDLQIKDNVIKAYDDNDCLNA